MELPVLVPVEYRGELVALVSRERVHIISPWLLERPTGDPDLRFVGFMCACGGEVLNGRLPGPFTSELAEEWTRCALIGIDTLAGLAGLAGLADQPAAAALNVPGEQLRLALRRAAERARATRPTHPTTRPRRGASADD
jgi:hypothetical protein